MSSDGGHGGELGAEVVTSATNTDDSQESIMRSKYEDLCRELNMDRQTEDDAYKKYIEVSQRCSLEGDPTHWLCCALYAACRQSSTPTVSGLDAIVTGNCVSLNNLLRSCHMSIYEFQTKIKQWCYMANLPREFSDQFEELQQKFSITYTLYNKYRSIFEEIFTCPPNEKKHSKYSSHSLHGKCSYIKLYDICWRLFLCAKNQKPKVTVDLVTSYNLLICCINIIYGNVLAEKLTDLIKPDFKGLPAGWNTADFDETQARDHCILKHYCDMLDEAKTMKATIFVKIMRSFFNTNTIYGNEETFMGLVSNENIDRNLKSLNISYEQYVLSVGEFDERILAAYPLDAGEHTNLTEQALRPPVTPLTRKQDLPPHQNAEKKFELMANVTHNVQKLRAPKCIPEPTEFVRQAGDEVIAKMDGIINQMEQKFHNQYPMRSEAENRFQLAKSIYFSLLDQILRAEQIKKPQTDLQCLLMRTISRGSLTIALMTCCVELVLEAYKTELKFPWILNCFSINAFFFHKIIELVVLHGNKMGLLSRGLIKHLNAIEETCLESLAWANDSPLWETIAQDPESKPLPSYNDVANNSDGKLQIFLRKVYKLGWLRIQKFCTELHLDELKMGKIWTIFEHSITHQTELMQDRHLDQIIMCAIYVYIRVTQMDTPKFIDIMRAYRNQPQAVNSVYREVLIGVNDSGDPKYDDVIYFYNNKYVPEMKEFSMRYGNENVDQADLLLSPHPIERLSLPKKLTQSHSLYVSQMPKNFDGKQNNNSPDMIVYKFANSPAKELQRMNEAVRGGKRKCEIVRGGKRMLEFNEVTEQKRNRGDSDLPPRLEPIRHVMDDRMNERQ